MAIVETYVDIGLPQFPDDALPVDVYSALSIIHVAIQTLVLEITRLTGVAAPDPVDWVQNPPSTTILTGNATRLFVVAYENLTAREIVNLFNDGGVLKARKAVASSPVSMAHGIAVSATAAGELVAMQWLSSYISGFVGLATGSLYYLSGSVPGAITAVAPVTSGYIVQPIGLAMNSTDLNVNIPLNPQLIP